MPSPGGLTQEDNRFVIQCSSWDDDLFILHEMTARESISGLYRLTIDAYSTTPDVKFKDVIGQPMAVEMRLRDEQTRYWHGVVARFAQGRTHGDVCAYRLEVVPWLWYLTRSSDCRIFQKKSTPEIIEAVFKDLGMTDFDLRLEKHEPRPYTVQYRETDFNFVCRLMEEAGISYFFEHEKKKHTLVLFDDASSNYSVPSGSEAILCDEEEEALRDGQLAECSVEQELPSGKYAINDYDYEDPGCNLLAPTASSIALGGNDRFEIYDYPGEYSAIGDGKSKVKLRMESEEAASHKIEGRGYRGDFSAGLTFDLSQHHRADFNITYLITSIVHHATQTIGMAEGAGTGEGYSNTFTCIPYSVPYRPLQLTPKPLISGAQTATVVGASGEEIDVDDQGRVVVQFHWDREGKKDENSSCRVRVSQNWAGEKWGGMFIPRIGQEVIVEFLEGDPDQPIITGRVYNGKNQVPYGLPANKTQSGVKSRSSKGGNAENFNELRFEDKKGSELVYIHAEKDKEIKVENDRMMAIDHDDKVAIGNDRKVTVEKNHTESIGANEKLSVEGDRTRTVAGNETVSVDKDQSTDISMNRTVTVKKDQEHTVSGGWTVAVSKDLTESVDGKHSETVAKEYGLKAKKILLTADDELSIKVGKAKITMKKNGDVKIEGGKINVKGSGDVSIKGSKVKAN